jgi:hypothetical protein
MDTPSLKQATSATVQIVPQLGLDGGVAMVVIVKQMFAVDRRGRVTRVGGAEIRLADEPWDPDSPETSSVRLPSDVCIRKPSTDVVVVGAAVGVYRPRVTHLDVLVRVGPVLKALRVFGQRVWCRGAASLALTAPEPFESLPLRWEYAYGGFDSSDPANPLEEPRNPVGCGVTRKGASLVDKAAPRIEDPANLIASERTRPAPAGVGALGRHWEPRRRYVGTMDERWLRERVPLLPHDFDDRYNQLATPELITPMPLVGGEPLHVLNMCEEGSIECELPRIAFFVGARFDDGPLKEFRPMLDTVLVLPNARRFEMTWRSAIPTPAPARRLRYVQVHEKEIL